MDATPATLSDLPDDLPSLKAMIVALLATQRQLQEENRTLREENRLLREQVNLLRAKRFGPSSEKQNPEQLQMGLFDEAEAAQDEPVAPEGAQAETIEVPTHRRGRPVRKPLPAELPRVEIVHDLPADERVCPHDGADLVVIGREVSEQLDIIPAQMRVLQHVRLKYGCPHCQEGVQTAPLPPQPIPKSMASPGLLAHMIAGKFVDGIPLYRLAAIFARGKIDLPRSTMAFWAVRCGQLVQPLINLLEERALASGYLQMDETTVQVLKEPGRAATAKSYMWVWRTGPSLAEPVILFDYDQSRSGQVPQRLLLGFQGFLQTDGYQGYGATCAQPGVLSVGCWAHARRKFDEVIKSIGKGAKPGQAHLALSMIQKLYQVERLAKEAKATPEERHLLRQEKARPIVKKLRDWMDETSPKVPPASALGKALGYLHGQWQRLIRYLDDGRLEIDNNGVENAIRPFVIGRKGWLFADTVRGAKASANLYSLIETAKANGHEPYRYLKHIFTHLPACRTADQFEALLPMAIDPLTLEPRRKPSP